MDQQERVERLDRAIREFVASDPELANLLVNDWVVIYTSMDEDNDFSQGYQFNRDKIPAALAKGMLVETLDRLRSGDADAG